MFVSSVIIAVIYLIIMAVGITLAVVLLSESRGKKFQCDIQLKVEKVRSKIVFTLWLIEFVCGMFLDTPLKSREKILNGAQRYVKI